MKIIIRIVLFLAILSCAFFNTVFALSLPEATITIVSVNNQNYYDIEITQDGRKTRSHNMTISAITIYYLTNYYYN